MISVLRCLCGSLHAWPSFSRKICLLFMGTAILIKHSSCLSGAFAACLRTGELDNVGSSSSSHSANRHRPQQLHCKESTRSVKHRQHAWLLTHTAGTTTKPIASKIRLRSTSAMHRGRNSSSYTHCRSFMDFRQSYLTDPDHEQHNHQNFYLWVLLLMQE